MKRLQRLRVDIRGMGGMGWTLYASDRLLDRVSRGRVRLWAFRFFAQPVPARSMLSHSGKTKLRISPINAGDIRSECFNRPAGAVEERFLDGSTCIAAVDGEELAGFMWLHFGRLQERLLACDFEPFPRGRTCWDYDLEVLPRFRLGRTFARLWDEAYKLLREHNVEASVSWIAFSNRSSQRAHERMGARPVGWLIAFEMYGWKLAIQSAWPFIHLALPRQRIHVRVNANLPG